MSNQQTSTVMAMVYVEHLLAYGRKYLSLSAVNVAWARNNLMYELHLDARSEDVDNCSKELSEIVEPLVQYAIENNIIEEGDAERFGTRLISMVMPTPQETADRFDAICYSDSSRTACDWLYELCQRTGYIPMKAIMRNPRWRFTGSHGDITVTINTAKPEKDPKEVAAAKAAPQTGYPKCMLCAENMGYYGRVGYPSRSTLRAIPLATETDLWYMQYSPYSYFMHHCIFFNSQHKPMVLGEAAYSRILDFVRIFPNYFVGSNAPLPIVGGSILSHDHYQGGAKVHPMFSRYLRKRYTNPAYPSVKFGTVDWYNSVVRMRSRDRQALVKAVNYVSSMWNVYSDAEVGIICRTGDVPHNCVTPIFRMERGEFYAELILRNNRTDEQHPFGIFHPTEDMHHIKKEAIGIIEVLGTFILPGRLASEMNDVADILCGAVPFDEKSLSDPNNPIGKHKDMIVNILKEGGYLADKDAANEAVRNYINNVCERILNCTAVFKNNEVGQAAFDKFMRSIGCTEFVFREAESAESRVSDAAEAPVVNDSMAEAEIADVPDAARTDVDVAEPVPDAPPKRKRGRPRKNPVQ